MPDYRTYPPEALAADLSFRRWMLYDDPVDAAFWTKWLTQNPDKQGTVNRATHLLHFTESAFDAISDEEVAHEISRLSAALNGQSKEVDTARIIPFRPRWYQVAAAVLMLLGLGWWLNAQYGESKPTVAYQEVLDEISTPLVVEENQTNRPRFISLPDGSTVLLQPQSRLTFPAHFDGMKRDVFLAGEAFFEVAKNPQKPFFVYAGSLVAKVLGTSFEVSAYQSLGDVKVVVKTGKVSVFALLKETLARQQETNELNGIVLTPNEQVTLNSSDLHLTRATIPDPETLELPIQRESFVFKAAPIKEVFDALEKSYGVRILFDEKTMKSCYLTASLSDEPLLKKLNLICKTIGAEYQQTGNEIIISSPGC